jgi:hypothetical protein
MKLKLGYPWLCLCLFFSLVMVSCVAKRNGTVQVPARVGSDEVYQLQVKLMTHGYVDDFPAEFISYLIHPYEIKYWDNNMVFRPQALILYFRFSDLKQLQQCRDQLLSTGQVEQISITKY